MNNIDTVLDWLNKLYGMPGIALVILLCIVVGYVLRGLNWFPNNAIPLVCALLGAVAHPVLAPACPAGTSQVSWRVRNAIIGIIVGGAAWAFHRLILKRFEDRIPWLKDWISEEEPAPAPPAPPANTTPGATSP